MIKYKKPKHVNLRWNFKKLKVFKLFFKIYIYLKWVWPSLVIILIFVTVDTEIINLLGTHVLILLSLGSIFNDIFKQTKKEDNWTSNIMSLFIYITYYPFFWSVFTTEKKHKPPNKKNLVSSFMILRNTTLLLLLFFIYLLRTNICLF